MSDKLRGHRDTRRGYDRELAPRPLEEPDLEDSGNFEGDEHPTTAEPIRDEHPQFTRRAVQARGDEMFDDDVMPTMIDPHVMTGAEPVQARVAFDPHARIDDNRRTNDLSKEAQRARTASEAQPQPVRANVNASASGPRRARPDSLSPPTVVELPSSRAEQRREGAPIAMPGRPIPDGPIKPPAFDPHARIDDSSRTNRWEPRPEDAFATPYAPTDSGPPAVQEPLRAISLKSPNNPVLPASAHRPAPAVQLRPLGDLNRTPMGGMGRLAPPHDPHKARTRRTQDLMIWASVVVITASIVTLVIWLIAR